MEIIKLRQQLHDRATGMLGTITHFGSRGGDTGEYIFAPKGIGRESGRPLKSIFVAEDRLEHPDDDGEIEYSEYPELTKGFGHIGKRVFDRTTGVEGEVVMVTLHPGGCLHVDIQQAGIQKATGEAFPPYEQDFRMVSIVGEDGIPEEVVESDDEEPVSPSYPEIR